MINLTATSIYDHALDECIDDAVKMCITNKHLTIILADFDVSEHRMGGDGVVSVADQVIGAMKDGWTVVTAYGKEDGLSDSTGTLIVAFDPQHVGVVKQAS